MEEEKFVPARENPRNLGLSNGGNKSMPAEVTVQKPLATILDRFRAMLKDREDGIRISADDDDPPPSAEEVVRLYELLLSELICNSKPNITDLTIIAGERKEHSEGIADAICARILEVPPEQKLPALYLVDSIVKNIGQEYVRYFSSRLPEVFCGAYRQVHPDMYPAMRHLFGTWSTVFAPSVLRKIEAELHFSSSAGHQSSSMTALTVSESPRPAHGIHVNPKYLEARRQFDPSNVDSNSQRTSILKIYGQKSAIGYDEYDSDNMEVTQLKVGAQRSGTTKPADRSSFADRQLFSSAARLEKSSPFRVELGGPLSPPIDEFAMESSPKRVIERALPSHPRYDFGFGRVIGSEDSNIWPRDPRSNSTYRRAEASAAYDSTDELQRPRALIDAYGRDQGEGTSNDRMKFGGLDRNGIGKVAMKTWQNTEEEEFDWEDMSPTVVDQSWYSGPLPSSIPSLGSLGMRRRPQSAATVEINSRRTKQSREVQVSVVDDSSVAPEDVVPSFSSGHGSISKMMGSREKTTRLLGSHYHQESQSHQIPFPASGIPSSVSEPTHLVDRSSDDAQFRGASAVVASRMGASSLDSQIPRRVAAGMPMSQGAWPPLNMQKPHPVSVLPAFSQQRLIGNQFELVNKDMVVNLGLNKSFFPENQLDNTESKVLSSTKLPAFPSQQVGYLPQNLRTPAQAISLQPHVLPSQQVQQRLVPVGPVSVPSVLPPPSHAYPQQGHNLVISSALSTSNPGVHLSAPILNKPATSILLQGGGMPALPQGPRPVSTQMMPLPQNPLQGASNPPAGSPLSGLIGSLMAQGLIALTKPPVQDSVGLSFNPDVLRVRHESAITALYADLSRQCTACGLRFKNQEEHSSHMDWHVTKNRISKNRKQNLSRRWFVSVNMWLTGAEALGAEAVPGFLPAENVVEQKDDEFAVPADENQSICALCGEPFDDFYSDETEEWMYKGAVYMNAPTGSMACMNRSQLGPIVHAKCMTESSVVSQENFGQNEGEEGDQRKRLRLS